MNQLKAGAVLNYIIIILNAIVGLLYTPYMLNKLGQSEYGLYSLVASVIAYLTILDFGFGDVVVRYTAKYRAEGEKEAQYKLFGLLLILYCIIGTIACLGGIALYFNVDTLFGDTMSLEEQAKAKTMMLILSFNLAITFYFQIFGSIITAYEKFIFQKTIQIVRIILNTIVMIALLAVGYKAIAMVVVTTAFNVLTVILNVIYCTKNLKIIIKLGKIDKLFLKEIIIYAFWIFLNVIMDKIYWGTGQFVLGAVSGTIAVSVFALAIHLENMYMSFSTAISGVFLPRVTAMVATNKSDKELSDLFIRTGRIQYGVLLIILCGFIVFGKQFLRLWVGNEYDDVYFISILFFVPLLIPLIQNVGISILQARNQMKFRSLLYICIAFVSLIAQIILAKRYNAVGCAIAISMSLLLGHGFIMNWYYQKKQRLEIVRFWKEIIKMSFVPILISLIGYIVVANIEINNWLLLAFAVAIYGLLYIPCFWKFSLSDSERTIISEPLKRLF